MTYQDVMEAIAAKVAALWPDRMLYRDYCPADFKRPSGFLYVQEAGFTDVNIGLVQWHMTAELSLFAATDSYTVESTEALRADQLAVLMSFGGPSIPVEDRHVALTAAADTPGPGIAYVRFEAEWMDVRPGYLDPDTAPESAGGAPLMEHYQLNVKTEE